jgi:hypothetical protein
METALLEHPKSPNFMDHSNFAAYDMVAIDPYLQYDSPYGIPMNRK